MPGAIFLSAVLALFQLIDGWTTYQIIKRGRGFEANPVVQWLIERLGLYFGLLVAKSWVVGIVIWGWCSGAWLTDLGLGGLFGLTLLYAWVLMGNDQILYGGR